MFEAPLDASAHDFCAFEEVATADFEHSVRGAREQDARMSSSRIRRASQLSRRTKLSLWSFSLVVLLFACSGTAVQAQSAASWNSRGQKAEAREDYDAAFEAYRQAHLKNPADLRYKTHYERLRFQAANMHVERGRVLRQSGDIAGAINEFSRSLQIDPGNQAASQELAITDKNGNGANSPSGGDAVALPAPGESTPHQEDVQRDIDTMGSPVQLQPVSSEPQTLHMVEDVKVIYQAIGKAAGLNVLFDPDYSSKRIPVDLTNVSLYDALRIVGTLSNTFWKPVTSNTIYVTQNNQTKRREVEDLAVQTFYLTNAAQQNDMNDILVAIRNLLDPSIKIFLVASQNAIVMRATTDQLILAEKIINDLDRTRSEVVVDVAVLEVSRDKIRNLGITLPTSFGLTPSCSSSSTNCTTGASTSTNNNSNGTNTPVTNSTNLTLNSLGHLNATNFAVTVSGGTVNALLSDSDTRILQNPRIRATDGQKATLKIGSKIPIATGSYNAGVATGVSSIGVQTQFTYIDVGVNIDMTPTVHYDREITLKMKIEVSAQNGSVTISGVTEPIISQRSIDQVIQLKEGEPSILAGILQRQDSRTVTGTPGLGEIPLLKYFFSTQGKEAQTDEIVFLLIPHIVRESIITDSNTRPVYTGTGNAVELIHSDRPPSSRTRAAGASRSGTGVDSQGSAANAASAMIGQMAAAARPAAPPAGSDASSSAPVSLTVVPPNVSQPVGSTFQVAVTVANAKDLFAVPVQLGFDPKVLSLVNVDSGDLLGRDGQAVALAHRDDGGGKVTISASRPPNVKGVDGQGTVCTLTFKAIAPGDSSLTLLKIGAQDSKQNNLPAVGSQSMVHVK